MPLIGCIAVGDIGKDCTFVSEGTFSRSFPSLGVACLHTASSPMQGLHVQYRTPTSNISYPAITLHGRRFSLRRDPLPLPLSGKHDEGRADSGFPTSPMPDLSPDPAHVWVDPMEMKLQVVSEPLGCSSTFSGIARSRCKSAPNRMSRLRGRLKPLDSRRSPLLRAWPWLHETSGTCLLRLWLTFPPNSLMPGLSALLKHRAAVDGSNVQCRHSAACVPALA